MGHAKFKLVRAPAQDALLLGAKKIQLQLNHSLPLQIFSQAPLGGPVTLYAPGYNLQVFAAKKTQCGLGQDNPRAHQPRLAAATSIGAA
jgi:hypothetical protein